MKLVTSTSALCRAGLACSTIAISTLQLMCTGGALDGPPQPPDAGLRDAGTGDAGTPPTDAGLDDGGSRSAPTFYFVFHADPDIPPLLSTPFDNLVRFMDELRARNATRATPHHVTVMFTPNWAKLIGASEQRKAELRKWIADGHEMAFHSHTHNHQFPDGYSNGTDAFGPDLTEKCGGDATAGECTLDYGLSLVKAMLDEAAGESYPLRYVTIGPQGNDGDVPGGKNGCAPRMMGGAPMADEDGCIDGEWTGDVATTFSRDATDYPGVTEEDTDDPDALLGAPFCSRYGEEASDHYSLPIAPYEIESGSLRVSLDTIEAAFDRGDGAGHIGIVVHPKSYVDGPASTFSGDARAQVLALFDAADVRDIVSRTMSKVEDRDDSGLSCHP